MSDSSHPIRVVAALITDASGRLLLVRKKGTATFMMPGGKVEPDEDALAALARELREEIGCKADVAGAIYVGRFRAPAANEPGATSSQMSTP